jgi:hypothetical protein
MFRITQLSVLLLVAGLAVLLPTLANATAISYTQSFTTDGSATSNGDLLSSYTGWTYTEYTYPGSAVANDPTAPGLLSLHMPSGTGVVRVSVSSQAIGGGTAFDISSNPLTVSTTMGGTGTPSGFNVGIEIGNILVKFHPGYGGGAARVELDDNAAGGYQFLANTDMGFSPALGTQYATTMTLKEDAGHTNYLLDFSIDAYDYATNHGGNWLAISKSYSGLGDLNRVGFVGYGSGAEGYFGTVSVNGSVLAPEPGVLVLLATGLLGLLAYAWRKRR